MSSEPQPMRVMKGNLAGTMTEGFVMGVLSTLCMSVWMLLANRMTPVKQPDPLPPEEITRHLTEKLKVDDQLSDSQQKKLSLFNHFLYGGLLALPLVLFRPSSTAKKSVSQGMIYALGVWFSNYYGLLPVLKLYPSAKHEPARMNGIMIVAHLIWGSTLGLFLGPGHYVVQRSKVYQ